MYLTKKTRRGNRWGWPGLTLRFKGDDDLNDLGAGGGGQPGGDPPQADPKPADAKAADAKASDPTSGTPKTWTVKVAGQEVVMTEQELIQNATKAAGADRRLQEAAEMRKQAEKGLKVLELSDKVASQTASQEELVEFVKLLGGDPSGLDLSMNGEQQGGQQNQPPKPVPVKKDQLDPELRTILDSAEEQYYERLRQQMTDETRKGVDADPILSKIVDNLPEAEREAVKQELYDMAMDKVRTGILQDQELFGPQLVQKAVQTLRARVQKLGISNRQAATPTIGTVPVGGYNGPRMSLPDKPIERVAVTDPDYIEKTTMRTLQSMQRMAAKRL